MKVLVGLPRHLRSRPQGPCDGFSLLEVILALAILAGAIAVLGELARQGTRNAAAARDQTFAQLLCQSKLAEIAAGIVLPEPVQSVPLETASRPGQTDWLYAIELESVDEEGLVAVWVSVAQDLPPEKRPVRVAMVRWMIDLGEGTLEDETEESSEDTASEEGESREQP